MKRYYRVSPRGFANEYSIISVDFSDERQKKYFSKIGESISCECDSYAERIFLKDAKKLISRNRHSQEETWGATEIEPINAFMWTKNIAE